MERRAPPPSWINQEFVGNLLEKKRHKKVVVDDLNVKYACVEGTGYASFMFRAIASFKEEGCDEATKESILVKVALDGGVLKDMLDRCHGFRTESLVLHEVMPQIHESLTSVEGDKFSPLTAECYHWGDEPKEFLVLQDLSAAGFQMAEGGKPLDHHHCRLVMRAYGRLHAASVKFLKQRPQYKDVFCTSVFTDRESMQHFKLMGETIFTGIADQLEKCPGYEKISEKYRSMINGYIDNLFDVLDGHKNETKLSVLAHGDCWKNNMMYKYVDGKVTDVRLVDLQMSNFNSPAFDLQYFLYSNAGEDVHREHKDSLLEEYHATLQTTLRKLGLELEAESYPLEELLLDMERYSPMSVIFSAMSGFVLTSEKYGAEFAQLFNDPEHCHGAVEKMFQNPYSLSYIKYLSPYFERKGLLMVA